MAKTNQQIIVTEGDFGVEILTQIIDANKKPVPIEGCSCKIKFAYNGNVISERTGIVIDEPKGIVSVILDAEETQYSGLWTSYWICYDQFNNVTTTENIYYYVQPAIGSVNNPAFTELLNYYNRDEVNDIFKSILEQLNNYTLTKDDVEKYIKFYVQNKIDDDFVRQCIVDAIGNGSDYVKKEQVEKINSQQVKLTNDVETINSQLDTMVYCLRDKKETEIDDTTRIQEAINELKNVGGNIYLTEKEYVVSNTLVIDFIANGNKKLNIIGKNGCNVTFLTKCEGKNTLLIKNANDGNYDDGVSISNIQIKPYDNTYDYKCNGIMLQNAIGCKLSNVNVYNMEYGIIFENDLGYTEQNVITNCLFSNCNRGVTFRVSARNEKWNGSFHGNIFKNTCISITRNNTKALNIEGGQLYNCRLDLKIMTSGKSPYLIYFNGDSEGNTGDISYEMFDSNRPKIACGDNARAKFFLSGNIFGKGGDIDWSEYKPISVGDLDYNNDKTPLESGDVRLGREKFYCYNIAPSNDIINNNKTIRYKPILSNIYDLWSGITNLFARYQNLDGKMENGYVMACKQEEGANSRLILGTIDNPKNNIKDMVIGMELSSDGSKIKSKQGSQLEFNNGYLSRNGKKIVDTGNLRFGKAIHKGFMYYPEGLRDIWGNIPITAGTSSTTVTLEEFELESIYNVQVTFLGANTGTNQVQVISATKSAITIGWNCSNNGTCYFRLLGYTPT